MVGHCRTTTLNLSIGVLIVFISQVDVRSVAIVTDVYEGGLDDGTKSTASLLGRLSLV